MDHNAAFSRCISELLWLTSGGASERIPSKLEMNKKPFCSPEWRELLGKVGFLQGSGVRILPFFPCCYLWDVTKEEKSDPKKKGFNKRKTTVLRMAVRIHYRHGLLHSLNRQKHFFFPSIQNYNRGTHKMNNSLENTHDKTNRLVLPPFGNMSGLEEARVGTFHGQTPLFT